MSDPNKKSMERIYAVVCFFPGRRLMSDDKSALVLGGKEVLVSNPFVTTQLGNSITWQAGSVEQLVQWQYFDLIVLGGTLDSYIPSAGGESTELIRPSESTMFRINISSVPTQRLPLYR